MEACTYVRTYYHSLLVDRVEFSEEEKKSRWPALNACTQPEAVHQSPHPSAVSSFDAHSTPT
jgi:hypothetical protein